MVKIYNTSVAPLLGTVIYSDCEWNVETKDLRDANNNLIQKHKVVPVRDPLLSRITRMPIFGRVAAVIRIVLCLVHVIYHVGALIVTKNKGHIPHIIKGSAELLKSFIEVIPLVGLIFSWKYKCAPNGHEKRSGHKEFLVKVEQNP